MFSFEIMYESWLLSAGFSNSKAPPLAQNAERPNHRERESKRPV